MISQSNAPIDNSARGEVAEVENPEFTEASERANIVSGESISTLFGKIKKFFTDLKTVAFSGSYTDLSDKPNVLIKTGDTMTGTLAISAVNILGSGGYNEGLRINAGASGYTTFVLGGEQDSVSGISDGTFWIGTNRTQPSMIRHLYIAHNGSTNSGTFFFADSASRTSPCLYIGWSGDIADGDARAVHGHQVYSYLASGNANRDTHDCNSALKNGVYYYTSNGPDTSLGMTTADGALYTESYDSNAWVAQIAQDYRTGNLCVRGKNNGTWQPWKRIIDSGNIGSQSVNYANSAGSANSAVTAKDHFYIYNGYSLLLYNAGNGTFSQLFTAGNGTLSLRSAADWINLRATYVQCRSQNDDAWSRSLAAGFDVKSSRRYKENIIDISEEDTRKLLDVRVVRYDYKDGIVEGDTHKYNQHGVIAEEVVEILPEVVSYAIPYGQEDEFDEPVPDAVDYSRFVPYLIKMVQMQQKEIEELKNEISKIKATPTEP